MLSILQRFRKFRSEFKYKGPFRFLPTGIFGITSGGGPLISVGIFRPRFTISFHSHACQIVLFVSLAVLFVSARVLSAAVHDLILRY